jgi:hypothetical protein
LVVPVPAVACTPDHESPPTVAGVDPTPTEDAAMPPNVSLPTVAGLLMGVTVVVVACTPDHESPPTVARLVTSAAETARTPDHARPPTVVGEVTPVVAVAATPPKASPPTVVGAVIPAPCGGLHPAERHRADRGRVDHVRDGAGLDAGPREPAHSGERDD